MDIHPIVDPTKLKKDGSNADTTIDIGSEDITTSGVVTAGSVITSETGPAAAGDVLSIHPDATGNEVTRVKFFENVDSDDEQPAIDIYGFAKSTGGGVVKHSSWYIDDYGRMTFGGTVVSHRFDTVVTIDDWLKFPLANNYSFGAYTTGGEYEMQLNLRNNSAGAADRFSIFSLYASNTPGVDFNHGAIFDPTLFIHGTSNTSTKYIKFTHDDTDGIIHVGEGDLNLSAAGSGADGQITSDDPIVITPSATDSSVFEIVGDTNDYSAAATGYTSKIVRDVNWGTNVIDIYYGFYNLVSFKNTDAKASNRTWWGVQNYVINSGTVTNESTDHKSLTIYGTEQYVADGGTWDTNGIDGDEKLNVTHIGSFDNVSLAGTITDTGGSASGKDYIAIGHKIVVSNLPTLGSGGSNVTSYGQYISVHGSAVGSSTAYGIYIERVSGADIIHTVWDASGGNWTLDGDDQKIILGEGQDLEFYFDGTYGRIDGTGDPIRIGDDTTNCAEFASNGSLSFHGAARVTRHLRVGAASWAGHGVNAPTANTEGVYYTEDFDSSADDEVRYTILQPFGWDETEDVEIAIDWFYDSGGSPGTVEDAGKVCWALQYLGSAVGEDITAAGTTITQLSAGNHNSDRLIRTIFTTKMLHGNLASGDAVGLRLYRDVDNGDTLGENARLIEVHFHFIQNKLGGAT